MKALVKYAAGDGNLDILDVEEPRCGDAQVKVEVAYCGVCGTDLHVMHETFRNYPPVRQAADFGLACSLWHVHGSNSTEGADAPYRLARSADL